MRIPPRLFKIRRVAVIARSDVSSSSSDVIISIRSAAASANANSFSTRKNPAGCHMGPTISGASRFRSE